MRRQLFVMACFVMSLGALADDIQTVTVGGSTIDKTVNKITFSGDNVVLHFTDGTQETNDMSVDVKLTFDLTSYIETLEAQPSALNAQRVYDLKGRCVGLTTDGLHAGIYIVNGKKVVVK